MINKQRNDTYENICNLIYRPLWCQTSGFKVSLRPRPDMRSILQTSKPKIKNIGGYVSKAAISLTGMRQRDQPIKVEGSNYGKVWVEDSTNIKRMPLQ